LKREREREKKGECAAFLKNSVRIFVEKIHKMGCLGGSGLPVLYIGRTVPEGFNKFLLNLAKKVIN
jgi:hypothetical protein